MTNQRIRNLTTGRLHTQMDDIYKDMEFITGEGGLFTHMLPAANKAMEPWLKAKLPDARFWDGKYDTTHTGETDLAPMNDAEKAAWRKAL